MLLAFGCTNTQTPTTQTAPSNEKVTNGQVAPVPTPAPTQAVPDFSIDSPTSSSVLSPGDIVVKLSPKNLQVVAPGENKAGQGHFHLFLDDGTYIPCASTTCTVTNVSAGSHTIKVMVQQNDHTDYAGAAVRTVTFTAN